MKQRLIDANDVNNHIIGWVDLRGCPTVEAIPIEFIKRFAIFSPPIPTYSYGEESIDMDAWCEKLLEQWRLENETS